MNEDLRIFNNEYNRLNEKDTLKFTILVNKLINVNYLTGYKEEDKNDYYFIYNNLDCFKSYFSLGGRNLQFYQSQKTFVLESEYQAKLSLSRVSSLILLIIRLLYIQKLKDISLSNLINISLGDIQEKYEQLALGKIERFKSTELENALRVFRKYNIINYKGNDFQNDDVSIVIYPTIQYVVNINDINVIVEKINSYLNKEEKIDEEISED